MNFALGLLTMAGVTYLIRLLPILFIKRKIKSRFIRSFLYYVPYAVLGVMTVPAIFTSTSYLISAIVGFIVACILAYLEKSLVVVAASACGAVLVCELIIKYLL